MNNQGDSIKVKDVSVRVKYVGNEQFISITDLAKTTGGRPTVSIQNWMRNRNSLEFLGYWEKLHNKNFKGLEFEALFNESGLNRFQISPSEWIEKTNPIGMINKAGRGGGTFAHVDIALHFANWLSVEFYTHLIKEFRRLKEDEANLQLKQWDLRRELVKASYEVQTDAIREHLVPTLDWHTKREKPLFASEADLLNQAIFGMTAREFKLFKPDFKGNLRDWATEEQLKVLDSMQSVNAAFIEAGLTQGERFQILWRRAKRELEIYESSKSFQKIKDKDKKRLE